MVSFSRYFTVCITYQPPLVHGITKLDKENNQCIREKNGSTGCSKGNKAVPGKMATTRTEDGHK
jgi:hypothetical protein